MDAGDSGSRRRDTERGKRARGLRIAVVDRQGRPLRAAGLGRWMRRVAPSSAQGALSVALVSDVHVRKLNRQYRRKDYATDVLSFPTTSAVSHHNQDAYLGDIVIARGVMRRQARAAGHSETTELRILALHGLLHLIGYDHETDDGTMGRIERRLRRKGGLPVGLIDRATGGTNRRRTGEEPPAE